MVVKHFRARQVIDDLELMETFGRNTVFFDEIRFGRTQLGFLGVYHGTEEKRMGAKTEQIMMDALRGSKGPVFAETSILETSSLLTAIQERVIPIDQMDSLWYATNTPLHSAKRPHIFHRLDPEKIEEAIKDQPPMEEGNVTLTKSRYPSQRYEQNSYWKKNWPLIMNENLIRKFDGVYLGDVDEDSLFKSEVLYLRGRSLLMAYEIAQGLKEEPEKATAVQGMYHMTDTMHFLENPQIAARYAQRLQKAFKYLIDPEVKGFQKPKFYDWQMLDRDREIYDIQVQRLTEDLDKVIKLFKGQKPDTQTK